MLSVRQQPRFLAGVVVLLQMLVANSGDAWAASQGDNVRWERSLGTVALNLGKYDEAVEHFSRAYELTQDPVLLFSLAQAYRLGGKADKSLAAYTAFLREAGGSAKYRWQIERATAEIENITSFMINHPVDSRANEKPGAVAESTRPLAPAKPTATLEPPEAQPEAAEQAPATLNTRPPALLPRPQPVPPPAFYLANENPQKQEESAPIPVYKRWWFWGGAAAVVALAAGGVAAWYYTQPSNQTPPSTYGAVRVLP